MNSPILPRPLFIIPHKTCLLLLSALVLLSAHAPGQNVDCRFSLYRTDAKLADALQTKLLAGGTDATQAMGKMPDLVRQGRIQLEAELKQQTPNQQRADASCGNQIHKNPDGSESKLGFNIEFEPVITQGVIQCRLSAQYQLAEKDGVQSHLLNTAFTAKSASPVLLSRWQEGDECLMLIATATFDSPAASGPIRMLYLDSTFFGSEADAKANRNPVARVVHPAHSGQHSSSGTSSYLYYKQDGSWEVETAGWKVEAQPTLADDDASVSLSFGAHHRQATGGKRKLPDGGHIPEVIHRKAQHSAMVPIAAPQSIDLAKHPAEAPDTKAQNWILTTQCQLYELK